MDYPNAEYLLDAATLHSRLGDENLRVFDCAVFLTPTQSGAYHAESGRGRYDQEHIPGAGFIDLLEAWSDTGSGLNFTLPDAASLAAAVGASGISAEHEVVLYSSGHLMWATRAWWLLHHAGHSRVRVLQGNLQAWRDAGYSLDSNPVEFPATRFDAAPRADVFADTAEVEAGMHGKVCTVNALSRSLYEGSGDFFYQRRGHIPGSLLVYYDSLLDNEHFLPPQALREKLEAAGILSAERVITYCGGGIAATLDGFAAKLLGHDNIAVYDGSMSEWVKDDSRPLTVGSEP